MATDENPEPGPATSAVASVAPPARGRRRWGSPRALVGSALALASVVALGTVLLRPHVPQPGEPVARLTSLVGSVGLVAGDGTSRKEPALQGELGVGDALEVGRLSGAEISFHSGSILRVGPETRVRLGGTAERPSAAWQVPSGTVRFSVGHRADLITTPMATVTAPPGASGVVEVGGAGHTELRCFRGRAEIVTATGATVTLREREAVRVAERGLPGEMQTLPRPPVILSPRGQAEFPWVDDPRATVELAWEPVPGGDTYRVALSYNSTQARLALPAALDARGITEARLALKGLDPGRYFWQVAAVSESGFEGAYSPASSFVVGPFPEEVEGGEAGGGDVSDPNAKVEPGAGRRRIPQ